MKAAISTDGEYVSAHFGRCPSYTIVDIEENKVIKKEIIENPGHHTEYLPQFLNEKNVDVIVAGGMGRRAQGLFAEANIETLVGVSGKIDEVIEQLVKGTLKGIENPCKPGSGKGYGIGRTERPFP